MKKGKRLIVLTLVLAVFIVGTVILQRINANKEAAQSTTAPETVAAEMDKASISGIAYAYEGESLRFTKDGENWKVADDPNFPLNESKITAMADALAKVTAKRTAADTMASAADFGLAEPALTVTATLADGTKTTLRFGDKNSVTGDTYLNVEGSPTVYTVASTVPGKFNYKLYALIADEAFPTVDAASVDKLTMKTPEGETALSYHPGGSDSVYSTSFTWLLHNPDGSASPADATKMSGYLTSLTGISYTGTADYDATPEELEKYGLAAPAASIAVDYTVTREEPAPTPAVSETPAPEASPEASAEPSAQALATPSPSPEPITITEAKRLTIELGSQAENGDYYLRHSDSNRVFTVSGANYDALTSLTAQGVRAMQVDLVPIDTVEALKVAFDGHIKEYAIVRTTSTDADGKSTTTTTYKQGDTEIDATAFKTFYNKLIGLKAEKVITQNIPQGLPYMVVDFDRNTEKFGQMQLRILPYDASFYVAQFNGETGLLVNKLDVEALAEAVKGLGE